MQPDSLAFLQDMLTQGERLSELVAEQSLDNPTANWRTCAMLERLFFVIGEAATQLRKYDPATAERITDLREMIALRNRLAHAYQSINPQKLWDIARTNIPLLIHETTALIQEGESEHP